MVELRESGELESDEPIEESSFKELNYSYSSPPTTYSPPWGPANIPDFPPSPTYFPVSGPTSFPPSPPFGKSTLKRICREYGIYRWPPRKGQELIGQSPPKKSPVVIDQEQIPQMNPDTLLPSNQVPATSDTYRVKVKGKKVSDMKALKTTEPKESRKSKKRDSSLSAECSKRKVDILEAKHNAKSTSVSVTSQDHGEPQGLLAECIKTLNAMENIDGESYMKAMKLLKDDPSWRPIFLDMSEQRKKDFVSYV
ncbi:hypothetical protein C3L33_22830, partial [Rhododendron williamsianum]